MDNNIIRVTTQALAAVLGGCQSLHTNSKDEALALPTEEAVKIALRTQQVIASETGVTKTVDPIGGSYYVENLTAEIEERVEHYLKRIERMGERWLGAEKGFFQDEIRINAYHLKQEIDWQERIIVGVNKFQDSSNVEPKLNVVDSTIEDRQVTRLKEFKNSRDRLKVDAVLNKLTTVAEGQDNVMPHCERHQISRNLRRDKQFVQAGIRFIPA